MFSPWMITVAPYFLQFSTYINVIIIIVISMIIITFMMGATMGITTVTGMSKRPP